MVTIQGLRPLPPEIKIALFRITQEALNNVAKHAEASEATISLHCYPTISPRDLTGNTREGDVEEAQVGSVELFVSDNGRGFDVDQVSPDHLGLPIMRERAEEIGATLAIESQLGHGTQVIVTWQNKQQKEQDDGIETN
jgi:two-component system nitrate/nitrite sensor histidine kinase NarX